MANNVNIQGVIPFEGPGYVNKPEGGYLPGEFRRLLNMEIANDGSLQLRRPVQSYARESGTNDIPSAQFIAGAFEDSSGIYVDPANIIIGSGTTSGIIDSPTPFYSLSPAAHSVVPIPLANRASTVIHPNIISNNIFKFIRYNKTNHWVSIAKYSATYSATIFLHRTSNPALDAAGGPPRPDYEDYNHYTVAIASSYSEVFGNFIDAFVFKDRLWIVTQNYIYFSKATDFSVWSAPDGGFFKFPDDPINAVTFNRDSIYVFSDGSVKQLSYSSDPNLDATIVPVSTTLGGEACCVYQDSIVFINNNFLYSLSNGFITKVRELRLGFLKTYTSATDVQGYTKYLTPYLYTFDDCVVINYRAKIFPKSYDGISRYSPLYRTKQDFSQPHFVYFLNMSNGCLSEFGFRDALELNVGAGKYPGNPSDFYTFKDKLYFLTVSYDSPNNSGRCYFLNATNAQGTVDLDSYDHTLKYPASSTNPIDYNDMKRQSIPVWAEIDSYVPDGTESFVKKFRYLSLDARLSKDLVTPPYISFAYGDQSAYSGAVELVSGPDGEDLPNRPPVSYRYPMNQRARALSIKINSDIVFGIEDYDQFGGLLGRIISSERFIKIKRMVSFWSYLRRLPVSNSRSDV